MDGVWVKGKVCFFQLPHFFSEDTIENVNNNLNQVEYAKFWLVAVNLHCKGEGLIGSVHNSDALP